MPDKHFVYGGSNAHIWFYCDAAGQLSRMVPYSEAGDAAKRGTRIHDFAYKIHNKYPVQGDEEEIAIAKKYIEDCNNISPNINLETMCSFDCNFGGTIDGWSIKDKTLYMWDLKTGKSKVKALNNEQLLFYAFLLVSDRSWDVESLNLGIYQNEKFDWWTLSKDEFNNWVTFILNRINHLNSQPLTLISGNHCLWCKAKSVCWEYGKDKKTQTEDIQRIDISAF